MVYMKKIIVIITTLLVVVGILLYTRDNSNTIDSANTNSDNNEKVAEVNMTATTNFLPLSDCDYEFKVAENEKFVLMGRADGNIAVEDKSSGFIYGSNPLESDPLAKSVNMTNLQSQLYIKNIDNVGVESSTNSTVGCVNKGWLTYEAVDNGITYIYDFQNIGITIPLRYILEEDGLRAEVVVEEIVDGKLGYNLVELSVLPFFAAAGMESQGYTLVPDGSGALIYHNNDKASYGAYSQYVYGRDIALTTEKKSVDQEDVCMPVFGMKDGNHGYLAIIEEGEANAKINAMTSGTINSYNNVYPSFRYRVTGTANFNHQGRNDNAVVLIKSPILPEIETYSIKYILINKENFDYGDMATIYRDYLISNNGLRKNENESSPLYLDVLGGLMIKDYILGIPINRLTSLTSYEEAINMIDKIREIGIEDIVVKYSGWQKGGLDSKIPAKIKFESKLGGRAGYDKLVSYMEENEILLYPDMNFVDFYKSGNGYSLFNDVTQTIGNTPAYQFQYDLNLLTKYKEQRWYILKPNSVNDAFNEMIKNKEKLKTENISLSTLGSKVYSDFTNSEKGIDRTSTIDLWDEVLDNASQNFNSVMVDTGYAYTFPYATNIYNAPTTSSKFDISDETIPFYQMVLHGYISYSTEPINLSNDPEMQLLKAVETGSSLAFCFMNEENHVFKDTKYNYIFSGHYNTWLNMLEEFYNRVRDVQNNTSNSIIVGHERLSNNLYKTTFENGSTVYVNYGVKDSSVDGVVVGGKDFVYINGRVSN